MTVVHTFMKADMSPKLHNFMPNFVKSSELVIKAKTTPSVYCDHHTPSYLILFLVL